MTDSSEQEAGADTVPVHGIVMRRSSLPSSRFGAWLVEKMQDGWVYLKSADLTATNKITRDHYNQICDEPGQNMRVRQAPPCTTQRLVGIAARAMSACRFSRITPKSPGCRR